jgi:peroxiredoxin
MLRESATLRTGDRAPDFTLPNQKGDADSLADRRSRGVVVLVFHRGTW